MNGRDKRLFYFVRDRIKYSVSTGFTFSTGFPNIEDYKASQTLMRGNGTCVQKAVLLAAMARAAEIPSRLCFAHIRNHLLSREILEVLNTNVVIHGYAELYIEGSWVKVTPTFDADLCEKRGYIPVDFDGVNDATFHRYDRKGRLHIEYLKHYGCSSDLPFDWIKKVFPDKVISNPRWKEIIP